MMRLGAGTTHVEKFLTAEARCQIVADREKQRADAIQLHFLGVHDGSAENCFG